jgi:hypothetical protein
MVAVGPGPVPPPAAGDPLRLDLPAIGSGSGEAPSASTLRVLASLYLAAELEQAGVVPIAELLADQRDSLDLPSYEAAAKLDAFAQHQHQWFDRAGRVRLFARLFGVGPGATNDAGVGANRDFVSGFASLCHALVAYGTNAPVVGSAIGLDATVRESAQAVLSNLAPRGLGNTLVAASRIEEQVRHAVDILRDPAIAALVGARTLQDTMLNILGKEAPDVQRLIDAGLAGQKVLVWLADALPRVAVDLAGSLLTPGDPVETAAETWLHATGLDGGNQKAAA